VQGNNNNKKATPRKGSNASTPSKSAPVTGLKISFKTAELAKTTDPIVAKQVYVGENVVNMFNNGGIARFVERYQSKARAATAAERLVLLLLQRLRYVL
jgi:hypothetical protein